MSRFKQIGTLLLCGLLFMRVMLAPVILLDYQLNKTFIIQNYCVNKSRPQLHCDGKCYLAKRLQKAQEREENHSKVTIYVLWLEVFHQHADLPATQILSSLIPMNLNYHYSNNYHHLSIFSLLKPPQG